MDGRRFDTLAKAVDRTLARRTVLGGVAGILGGWIAGRNVGPVRAGTTPVAGEQVRIAYVLYGTNAYTDDVAHGAEAAGRALGVEVVVFRAPGFDVAQHVGFLREATNERFDGIAVAPLAGDAWDVAIAEAIAIGIPVVTAYPGPPSGASLWVGPDDVGYGRRLAEELRRILAEAGIGEGLVVIGICTPEAPSLVRRTEGVKEGLAPAFTVRGPEDVGLDPARNLAAWTELAAANPEMVAAVGICSQDVTTLSEIREQTGGAWVIGGSGLNLSNLEAVKAGKAEVLVASDSFLQGYLPVRALVEHLVGAPLPAGWLETPVEVVTAANVDEVIARLADPAAAERFAQGVLAADYADLASLVRPLPAAPATPSP